MLLLAHKNSDSTFGHVEIEEEGQDKQMYGYKVWKNTNYVKFAAIDNE